MNAAPLPFHYLVTIHNKEALLPEVLAGIARCARPGAVVVPVLDGCTDGSEAIVRRFAAGSGLDVRIAHAEDVHEIRSINAGLRLCEPGFCMILQDDVVLQDPELEARIRTLHREREGGLGCLSLRMGGDLVTESPAALLAELLGRRRLPRRTLDELPTVGSVFDTHPVSKRTVLEEGKFLETAAIYKSPVCLTPELRALEPLLDENLAPYACDDIDLSVRSLARGLRNGVLALRYASDIAWGGTRTSKAFNEESWGVILRNRRYLWRKHRAFLTGPGRRWLRHA